ncbi:uncharacterized protein LOC127529998 [Erpetoichthys calabaricus]|uniref:uncharacterized protein LOC127529998 n=1 Tax=Erpetoichthys calabaricus TaxID=27687 RepID=UPI002234847A|nr:uncharacterized protein LOC127529998 [Erpetoichthys calabaricus]
MNYSGHLSENIFDPCRESELLNMYRRLKKESWPHLKDRVLQFKERKPVQINRLGATIMKSSFEKSQNVMKERIENIMASLVLDCSKESKGSEARGVLEKVHENQKFLQMKVLSCNMNFLMESVKDICQSQNLGEKEFSLFQEFAAECFRVSALMCLHSPELLPSWETEVDGFNFITGLEEEMVIFPAIANKKQIVCPPEIVSYNLSVRK